MKRKILLSSLVAFMVLFSLAGWGQILTFEFSALAGGEATAPSNYNDANLSPSLISRGAGLTAAGNTGRFNATSWALTSIENAVSGDDYMEITITPLSGFQFSVSSIYIQLQRSSTGPSAVALRSSVDNYASNLDQEYAIVDNTNTQSFTFTFTQSNSTVPVTYRFYKYAESTAGSGGIGDGTGNDIVVYGAVSSTGSNQFPAITNIAIDPAVDITSSTTVSVSADVTDSDGTIAGVELHWGTVTGNLINTIQMSNSVGDTYVTISDIPAQADGTTVYYEIEATDDESGVSTSPEQHYIVRDPRYTTLPYEETFETDLGDCYTNSVSGNTKEWVWNSNSAYINGFNSGDTEEDWLILPGINLNNYSDEALIFDTYYQYGTDDPSNYLKLFYSTDYPGIGDPTGYTWTELAYTQPASATTWASSGFIDLSSISGTSVWIGFKYRYEAGNYRLWRVDNISAVENPLLPEPSNHVTNFLATANSASQITVTWTDAVAGAQAPSAYLVKAAIDPATAAAPVDGTPEADGALVLNIAHGSGGAAVFNGLSASTTYNFAIWPYTNLGVDIDYKTDGTVPTASETTSTPPSMPTAWINEFHYDNVSGDVDEMVEVVILNAGSYLLSDFTVNLYNGNGGVVYDTKTLDQFTVGSTYGNFTFYHYIYPVNGIQNGAPDGLALSYNGTLITGQFLSYEGVFIATDGPAVGVTSTDVGVSQNGTEPIGYSLQLGGHGSTYGDFTWQGSEPSSHGTANFNQTFFSTDWTGAIGNDWANAGNWNSNVPASGYKVTIPGLLTNYPTITAAATCNSLVMEYGASLKGQQNLTLNGNATVKTSFTGYTSDIDGWYLTSSPVGAFDINGSDFDPGDNDDFYGWSESEVLWKNHKAGFPMQVVPATGYLVAYTPANAGIKRFIGALNAGSYSPVLTAGNSNWNLIGNPYPSPVDWSEVTLSDVSSPKVLDNTDGSYDDVTADVELAQGLFVYAESGAASVTFETADQTHGSAKKDGEAFVYLRAQFDDNDVYLRMAAHDQASQNYEWQHDSRYLAPISLIPYLAAVTSDDIPVSTYVLGTGAETALVPLYFAVHTAQDITFRLEGTFNYKVVLEDQDNGSMTSLSEGETYSFTAQPAGSENRFKLHLTNTSFGIGEPGTLDGVHVYAYGENLYVSTTDLSKATVTVYNTLGQEVISRVVSNGLEMIRIERQGAYIVKVQATEGTATAKVIIQ